MPNILVVDDKENMRKVLSQLFEGKGMQVDTASNGRTALDMLEKQTYDVVITDLKMPDVTGMEVLERAKELASSTEVIVITAYGTVELAVEAMKKGAADFIMKPCRLDEMEIKVDRLLENIKLSEERTYLRQKSGLETAEDDTLLGKSSHIKEVIAFIKKIAPTNSSVLIQGESGTGKELVARAIHRYSLRKDKPFISVNCASLAPGVLESELFGHEKGSFTGALAARKGRFELADQGTIFLDEVADMDAHIQIKLLRVLQEGAFERVGGNQTQKSDVRLVSATNRDVNASIEEGKLREDFFYRLNVISINLLPLRERPSDIGVLALSFARKSASEINRQVSNITPDALKLLQQYSWPGNVRELQNTIERAVILCEGNAITPAVLPSEIRMPLPPRTERDGDGALIHQTQELEREMIEAALVQNRWNRTKAAAQLGIKRTTLQYKMKKYGL